MRYDIGPTSCRVCLQQEKKVRSIYKAQEEGDETPSEMLIQLLGMAFNKLNQMELAPEIICRECELALNMAFQFRQRAIKVQSIIEEYCMESCVEYEENASVDDMFIKEEEQTLHGGVLEEEEINEVVDDDYDGHDMIEDEPEEEDFQSHKDDIDIDIEVDSNDNNNEEVAVLPDYEIEYLEESYLDEHPQQEEIKSESADEMVLNDIKSERKSKRAAATRTRRSNEIHGSIKKDKQNGFICDICGNIYEKRGRMLEHRRRHDVVQHYQCELCEKRFPAREQLRKHIYSHTGTKPYKCSFCSRTFFYESVLKTHEDVHRGYKPYVCKTCNKAFAYSHSLTKHELIHKDIKMYHCEFCNKDFRLQHHMRQHEETKCHQNAVAQIMKREHPEIKTEDTLFGQ